MRILFVGGQHHGELLPVSEESLSAAYVALDAPIRADAEAAPYAGYALGQVRLESGGVRIMATHASARGERFGRRFADACCVALESYERQNAALRRGRSVPLNEALPDEPGVPAKRRPTRSDVPPDSHGLAAV